MLIQMPHKKMEKIGTYGFIAKCDCGHEHKFKGTDFDLSKSNAATGILKDIYICPDCGTTYDGIFENKTDRDSWYRRTSPIGLLLSVIIIFGILFGGYKIINTISSPTPINTDINKATNKELNDFYKWDEKQQQQKRDNQPYFNNGN